MLLTSLTAEPTIQRYEDKGRGRNTLSRTFVSCSLHFLVKHVVELMTSGDSSFLECCLLEGVHGGDEEENISRTPVISWEKEAPLLLGVEHGAAAILWIWSLISLCLVMRSPRLLVNQLDDLSSLHWDLCIDHLYVQHPENTEI